MSVPNDTRAPDHIILEGLVGSRAYGLDHAKSDTDMIGCYIKPATTFLGLRKPPPNDYTIQLHDPDVCYHEVAKQCRLMLKCNPTAMELLWLDNYSIRTEYGDELISARTDFLSRKYVRDAYLGYSSSQLKRLVEKGRFGGSLETRREKHARHLMRLLDQGYQLYTTGELTVRVADPDKFFEFGRSIVGDPEAKAAIQLMLKYHRLFEAAGDGVLPEHPKTDRIETIVQRIRKTYP